MQGYKLTVILLTLVLTGCVRDKPEPVKPQNPVNTSESKGVFITNEGNYQWGNASVSNYRFDDHEVIEDVFRAVNKRPLGDVCQSMTMFNEKAYIVVNNSGKVEVVNPVDFTSTGVITGLVSPRYFLGVNSQKAYVTDLYSNSISVVDLNTLKKVKEIACRGWTEELVMSEGKVFVTSQSSNYLYVVDPTADILVDSIMIGWSANSIRKDKYDKLWVLCGGKSSEGIPGSLYCVNPVNGKVETSLTFPVNSTPWRLNINGAGDTLYYLNNGVYQFPIGNAGLPQLPLIREEGGLIYGLGIDPVSGEVYVSDAIDYVQKGKVLRYKSDGSLVASFNVGVVPGGFCFY